MLDSLYFGVIATFGGELERVHFPVSAALMLHTCPQICYSSIANLVIWRVWLPDREGNTKTLPFRAASTSAPYAQASNASFWAHSMDDITRGITHFILWNEDAQVADVPGGTKKGAVRVLGFEVWKAAAPRAANWAVVAVEWRVEWTMRACPWFFVVE